MEKAIFITEMPKNCYNCPYCDESGGDGDWWCNLQGQYLPFENSESEERDLCCPLKPYQKAIPIEWIKKEIRCSIGVVRDGDYDYTYASCILQLLERWEKENE